MADLTTSILPALIPGIDVEINERRDLHQFRHKKEAALVTAVLRSPGWVDLPKDDQPESVNGIIHVLSGAEDALVQLLLDPTWMTTEDGRQPAFWLAGRFLAFADNEHEAKRRAQLVAASFGQLAGFNGLRFDRARRPSRSDLEAIASRRQLRPVLPPGTPVTASQAARLFHPPSLAAGHLHISPCLRTPTFSTAGAITLGEGRDARGASVGVTLNATDLLRHALVVGPSGTGKTTFLAHLARELAHAGHGVTVIDPHGALVRDIARTLPPTREPDAALVSFADTAYPIALNPLRVRPGLEFVAADELVEVIERVYGREYWGPLLDLMLRHAALAAIELGGSLIESARLLDDPYFRERAIPRIQNAETARVLGQLGDGLDRRLLPAINRLQRLLGTPWLRNIVGQNRPGFDFGDLFERNGVGLFDLSGIGTTNARLLGSLLLLLIRQATLSRTSVGGGNARHFVLVDEASLFLSRTVAELFDQARKFGVGIVLAVQRAGQLAPDEVREAVRANAGTVLTFRANDGDEATFISRHLASERIGISDLRHLPAHEAYVQVTRDGQRLEPAWLRTPAPPAVTSDGQLRETRLREAARRRYARPRAVVEAELRARDHALTAHDEEPEIRRPPHAPALLAHASGSFGH